MIQAIAMFAVGAVLVHGGLSELVGFVRRRSRLRRTTATIVGLHEPASLQPGSRGRSPVFEFTTQDGYVVRATSAASTFPEPKVGTRIPVSYDPSDPLRTAERPGVRGLKVMLSPLLVGLGVFLVWLGTTYL